MKYCIDHASPEELYHHGVKGMKWGVRKNPEYRADVKRRKNLTNAAELSSRWLRAYNQTEKWDSKRTERRVNRDMTKRGALSEKTKRQVEINKDLKKDRANAELVNKVRINNLQKHVDGMIAKYGSEKVKDVKYKIKDGQKYVNKFISSDNAQYTVELRSTVDAQGNRVKRYVPVRTEYHYYYIP